MKLFVAGLPYAVTESQLFDLFSEYGPVSECHLATDRETRQSRGFAFVTLVHARDAMNAIQNLDECPWEGRRISVREALERSDRPVRNAEEVRHAASEN
jgi:RNA recognition motif-containing protein